MLPSHLYSDEELSRMGFAKVGTNVRIDRSVRLFGTGGISIGNNVRIDCFCVISAGLGKMNIGSFIHVASYTSIIGSENVEIMDFANLSTRCSIFTSSDDYSGGAMSNPMVPDRFKSVRHAPVRIGRHAIIGAGSVLLPGVSLGTGAAVGALTVVRKDVADFAIVAGNPAKILGERGRQLLELEKQFLAEQAAALGPVPLTPAASPPP